MVGMSNGYHVPAIDITSFVAAGCFSAVKSKQARETVFKPIDNLDNLLLLIDSENVICLVDLLHKTNYITKSLVVLLQNHLLVSTYHNLIIKIIMYMYHHQT